MNNFALKVENLGKIYSDFELKDVSFEVEKGSIMGLVGQNGAGKTTVMRLIMNMIDKNSGRISVFGYDNLVDEISAKNLIGYVADEDFLINSATLNEHRNAFKIMFENWSDDIFDKYVAQFELPRKKKVFEFSKGMKTRAMIALALAHQPQILILDEPTAGLDPVVRIEILDILREFVSDGEKSVLFSTHITSDLDKVADYITMIINGKVVESAGIDEVEEKYVVISGSPDLAKGKERFFIGERVGEINFEALILRNDLSHFSGVNVQNPTIENILTFNIWGHKYEK